ncbi:Eco57I restriction-modification methylase domain-containing protein [Flavobacterium sp. GB2R13]|uniref:DUF7149 domain-containing protein n=1 Tax=Flavobacterium algoris TaxID=3398733 RepID=UPI003A88CD5B
MNTILLEPRKALNKAFLKIKPNRTHIESFKTNLIQILDSINEKESEEFHKNLVIDFLKKTYYDPSYSVNTKGRNDLVIHNGKNAKTNVGVIIEAKSPVNKTEMITVANLNGKALQELVLYYMRERITHKNTELKHLVVTNIHEWFVFDAQLFNKLFAENKPFAKQFIDFEEGRLSGKTTDYFYKEIAKPFIEALQNTIEFAHFDIRKYDKPLRNADKEDDKSLVALFKLLSPEHLLKLSFANDSNSLDKNFYSELLHIIGLTEVKEGGKKLIERHKQGKRNSGSLLENAIEQLDSLDKISRLQNPKQYGETNEERLFTVALELTITWVNRILFLKLLEAQLITYHKGDKSYSFLNSHLIKDYDNLNSLFFQVLAKKPEDRNERVFTDFAKVPYLNSSLFEPTDLEHETLFISQLEDNNTLPLLPATVIKDNQGKKNTGTKKALDYFFSFLDAYDFASEGSEDIQEDNKTLINASVLGLIFEKINGYKDGSFFTPSFITMYMCKETIRRAVIQKFNETKNWDCNDFDSLYDKIEDRKEANEIINSLKICDPAVGSGHFLVSALNEIIAIKNDLRVLQDHNGNRLKEYHFEVVNDELIVTDEDGIPFSYNPKNKESQRIQETLFHEKQTIIENCLFGVDINPNSVKICRLRLWIELLKNAYYKTNSNELETLPNIDINIKCGNSLISRFGLDAELKEALKKSKLSIKVYKNAVNTYRNAESKEQKREMECLIADIKTNFRSEINKHGKEIKDLIKNQNEYYTKYESVQLFDVTLNKVQTKYKKELAEKIKKQETEIEEIKSNKIYENAFEWRFEFPDVLNDEGDFLGFDMVIGNPPYGVAFNKLEDAYLRNRYKVSNYQIESYTLFTELGINIGNKISTLSYIIPNAWYASTYDINFRKYLITNGFLNSITNCPKNTFEEAVVETCIIECYKTIATYLPIYSLKREVVNEIKINNISQETGYNLNVKSDQTEVEFLNRLRNSNPPVMNFFNVIWGIKIYKKGIGFPPQTGEESKLKSFHSSEKLTSTHKPLIGGSEIFPYFTNWKGGYVNYGKWIAEPRQPDWFDQSDRLVVREVTSKGKIHASLISHEAVFSNSVDVIKSKSNNITELKILLAILNSKFACFYHLRASGNSNKDVFPKILIKDLKYFPFPQNNQDVVEKIIPLINEIMELKKIDSKSNISSFERQIDLIIYALYGLSEEEIKIIEKQ